MLAGDVVALYYKGGKYSKVTGTIDYSKIYTNDKYSFIYVHAKTGKPEILYFGGNKFAKIAQATSTNTETWSIGRKIEPTYFDHETQNTTIVTHPWASWSVTWSRHKFVLENGTIKYDDWKVTKGDPNFPMYEYPDESGWTKPYNEPAIYAYPGIEKSWRTYTEDGQTWISTVDGRYLNG